MSVKFNRIRRGFYISKSWLLFLFYPQFDVTYRRLIHPKHLGLPLGINLRLFQVSHPIHDPLPLDGAIDQKRKYCGVRYLAYNGWWKRCRTNGDAHQRSTFVAYFWQPVLYLLPDNVQTVDKAIRDHSEKPEKSNAKVAKQRTSKLLYGSLLTLPRFTSLFLFPSQFSLLFSLQRQ